jgi:hypothetical protein
MIVWLVEATKNLFRAWCLIPIFNHMLFCEVDLGYLCNIPPGNISNIPHCLWQLISLYVVIFVDHLHLGFLPLIASFYFQENVVAPVVFLAFRKYFWSLSSVCWWKTNLFFSVRCAIVKSVEGLVYLLEPCSFGSVLSHSFLYVLFAWMR